MGAVKNYESTTTEPLPFLAHQIGTFVVFPHVRYFYLTPIPALGKIKNEQRHAGRTSIDDVIVMLK